MGRRDGQFKRLGCRVNLLSVERELRQLEDISDSVVTRERDVVVAYVQREGERELMEVRRRDKLVSPLDTVLIYSGTCPVSL